MQPYEELEVKFQEMYGGYAVACSSGTAALHLAVEALQLFPRRQLIVPEFTMIACPRAVSMAGLDPVFVDCEEDMLCDARSIASKITEWTQAIMAVHIYGRRCNMEAIHQLARHYRQIPIIEDMAEVHGLAPHPSTAAACWSFYKNKIINGEEGGLVLFKDEEHANRARELRSQGFTEDHDFTHVPRAHNYRLSNVHARLVLDSLGNLEENLRKRWQVITWYEAHIPSYFKIGYERQSPWVYDIRKLSAHQLRLVQDMGYAARPAFKPCSSQLEYFGHYHHLRAYRLSKEVMYLPVHPDMTEDDVLTISETLQAWS